MERVYDYVPGKADGAVTRRADQPVDAAVTTGAELVAVPRADMPLADGIGVLLRY